MATASDRQNEEARIRARQMTNQPQGRSNADTLKKTGPAVGNVRSNATMKGGVNRATKGL